MVDAKTTSRWYFVIAMGRKAGHLALGIGKAAGATLTLIPEEFPEGGVRLKTLVDTLVGSIIKRLSYGRRDGVAILAEGLVLDIPPEDLAQLDDVERDAHGNVRIAEVNIGEILKAQVQARLKQFGIKTTIVAKNIGYELRCADPIPFDMEYTRDLGYCATKYLLSGGNAAMVSLQGGHFVPVPFQDMLDPKTGKAKIRLVDIHSTRYAIARRYMIRLRRDDFEDPHELAKFAATCGMHLQEFRDEFEYLIKDEPPPLDLEADAAAARPRTARTSAELAIAEAAPGSRCLAGLFRSLSVARSPIRPHPKAAGAGGSPARGGAGLVGLTPSRSPAANP